MAKESMPWSGLHSRAAALPAERRACLALDDGRAALSGDTRDLGGRLAALAGREDLGDSEVACGAFALVAVTDVDSTDATLRASMRVLDAAYARVRHGSAGTSKATTKAEGNFPS
jgi:hypothetical protein